MDDERLALMERAFIDGFRKAPDKQAFLLLSRVALELDRDGAAGLKLVEVRIDETYGVGTVHPGFGSRELVHQALPGEMITRHERLSFVYVAMGERRTLEFREVLAAGG